MDEEQSKCGGCGQPLDEALDQEAENDFAATAVRCYGCAARERASQKFEGDAAGLRFVVEKRS